MSSTAPFRRLVALGLALILAMSLVGPEAAFAANTGPDTATPLSVTNNRVSATLVGSTGGAYQYYRVNYQGSNAPVNFTLTYQPGFGTGNGDFGFNLYGPSGLAFAGQVTNTTSNSATAQYTLANNAAITLLVQIYNYTPGASVNYTLTINGLSGGSTAVITGQTASSPGQAQNVTATNATIGGTIVGAAAGAFQYFNLHYPGGNASMTITMNASPTYTAAGSVAYGFTLYQTLPNGQTSTVANSSVTAQDTNSMTLSATVTQPASATYQLQVYNYWPGVTVHYGIQATGLALPAPVVSGNTDSGHAVVLNSAHPGATATLPGANAGAFNYYLVKYPGSASSFNLSVTYKNAGGAQASALGFNVYEGANLVATAHAIDNGSGVLTAVWTYTDANPHSFGVQVFNYQSGATATYTIYESGSQ